MRARNKKDGWRDAYADPPEPQCRVLVRGWGDWVRVGHRYADDVHGDHTFWRVDQWGDCRAPFDVTQWHSLPPISPISQEDERLRVGIVDSQRELEAKGVDQTTEEGV